MSFTNKCQPLTSHIIHIALRYIFRLPHQGKNLSRRKKNIYKLIILTLLKYVAYVNANACNLCSFLFQNLTIKVFLDCTYTGQAWSSKRLFVHISCRLSPRGHKLHIYLCMPSCREFDDYRVVKLLVLSTGVMSSIPGFSSLSYWILNQGPYLRMS